MTDLLIAGAAIGFVVMLGGLAKIHRQIDELLTLLKKTTTSIKGDTTILTDRMEKMEYQVDKLYEKQNRPSADKIRWVG